MPGSENLYVWNDWPSLDCVVKLSMKSRLCSIILIIKHKFQIFMRYPKAWNFKISFHGNLMHSLSYEWTQNINILNK